MALNEKNWSLDHLGEVLRDWLRRENSGNDGREDGAFEIMTEEEKR